MKPSVRIGEYRSLGTAPYFYPLKNLFPEASWCFVPGTPGELMRALEKGEVDVALAPALTLADGGGEYAVFPHWGYAGRGHMRDILLFSDIYLDDMDELTVSLPADSPMVGALMRLILEQYLQYQNQFVLGWGSAEAYVLEGDAALRERALGRYSYIYDVGDLWRHYTGRSLIYYLWVVRLEAVERKGEAVREFHECLSQALRFSQKDWNRLAAHLQGYEWLRRSMMRRLWEQVDYELKKDHFEGLSRFFEDCQESGIIEEVPEVNYYPIDFSPGA